MLSNTCETLPGVGPNLAAKLLKCGIHSIQDLLFHLPFRYQDRTRITAIQDLRPNEWCVVAGRVCKVDLKFGKKMIMDCYVQDKTGIIKLRFFHYNKNQIQALKQNPLIRVFGEVKAFNHSWEMTHPEYQLLEDEETFMVEEHLTPIYPSTQGLSQKRLRQIVNTALGEYKEELNQLEWMPENTLQSQSMVSLGDSIHLLHNPPPDISLEDLEQGRHPALKRLVCDELIAHRLSMQFAKDSRNALSAPPIPLDSTVSQHFLSQLPFTLTQAQQRVVSEISQDLTQNKPMLRLLQGDVGAGKTIVAACAALQAITKGYQVAFMAPTDILTEQHTINLTRWFKPLGITIFKLSGKMKIADRRAALRALADNTCQLIVGTHALFQAEVAFSSLGLIIIDEQHRFGVEQRLLLQQKGHNAQQIPHQLLMTATPIPRTLAMTHFAHLDISIIDELPPNRTPIVTAVLNQQKRDLIILRLQEAIAKGRQAYWVCTLIEESEKLQCMAATATAQALQEQLSTVRVGLIHGRMSSAEKETLMEQFKDNRIDLLVATTVIEVGVDVPNASLMIIENAERLGLSQLHQLRGRVGRGSIESHCLLLYQAPLSFHGSERLKTMRATQNGFIISEKDLELRGAGEILGTKQTGYRQFKIVDMQRDKHLLEGIAVIAKQLATENLPLAKEIAKRWLGNFEQFFQS